MRDVWRGMCYLPASKKLCASVLGTSHNKMTEFYMIDMCMAYAIEVLLSLPVVKYRQCLISVKNWAFFSVQCILRNEAISHFVQQLNKRLYPECTQKCIRLPEMHPELYPNIVFWLVLPTQGNLSLNLNFPISFSFLNFQIPLVTEFLKLSQ